MVRSNVSHTIHVDVNSRIRIGILPSYYLHRPTKCPFEWPCLSRNVVGNMILLNWIMLTTTTCVFWKQKKPPNIHKLSYISK
jgi:hypothetical protein